MDTSTLSVDNNCHENSSGALAEDKEETLLQEESYASNVELENVDNPEKPKSTSCSGVEDEDVVLGGDESAKEFDGNIDEDELLKDTEVDEERKKLDVGAEEAESTSKPETDNVVQIEDFEESNLDTNQNVNNTQTLENEDQNTDIADKNPNVENKTQDVSSTVPSEPEGGKDTHESTSKIDTCDVDGIVNNDDNKLSNSSNLENEINIETANLTESTKKGENTGSSGGSLSEAITSATKDSAGDLVTDPDSSLKENHNDSLEIEGSKDDNREQTEEGTKFFHVDQDNSRPDESFDTAETGGEDPFAQTLEESLDTTESSEKTTDLNKEPSSNGNNEEMDVDDNSLNEVTDVKQNGSEAVKSVETTEICTKENNDEQNLEVEVTNKNADSTTSLSPPAIEADSSSKRSNEIEKTVENNEVNSHLEKIQDDDFSIVPDKVTKESKLSSQVKVSKDSTAPNSTKNKTMKTSHKSKNRSRDSSSDDSDDNDFEIGFKSDTRPKRSAARKAESQIKEMSVVDEELEPEEDMDLDVNDVEDTPADSSDIQYCYACKKVGECKINVFTYGKENYFCDETCFTTFRDASALRPGEGAEIVPPSSVIQEIKSADFQPIDRAGFVRKCSQCSSVVKSEDEKTLSWETMDFCSEECLGKYQQDLGSHCANCKGNVQPASLGKYCVRFGYEVKQFCCSSCLEEFKKGLKVCSFCQKDISSGAEGFLAPVGDKGTFKDFCTQACMEKYEQMSNNQPPPPQMHPCHVCNNNKLVEVEVFFDSKVNKLCSDICFTAYKFANQLTVDRCDMCRKYFDKEANGEKFNIFYDEIPHNFCCKTCMNVYILAKRKIVPCNWCKVKKYNFDMIKRVLVSGQVLMMCSLNCLTLYQVSVNAVSSRRIKCDMCLSIAQAQYHLTMSDATIRNFCTYPCVMNFQQQYSKSPITLPGSDAPPIPTGAPKRVIQKNDIGTPVPIISSVSSLANGQSVTSSNVLSKVASGKLNLLTPLLEPLMCRNKNTQTRPVMITKSVSCRPHTCSVETQTDEDKGKPLLIPIPVPIYVPCPMAMYSLPFPVPIPFPLPIPVPVFLPTTRNSFKGIMKEIKRIQEKVPADPYEAELLMMAEMVAEDKKDVATSSDSDNEPDNEPPASDTRPNSDGEDELSSEAIETNNTIQSFGDDIMQMALKMATELDEPAVDLESQLTPATILNQTQSENNEENVGDEVSARKSTSGENRGQKRSNTKSPVKKSGSSDTKRRKQSHETTPIPSNPLTTAEEPKPDANMKLKYTFGVNAWKSWVTQKNAEIEKLNSTNKKIKPFKTDILQLTTDELNFSLCLFVKEVKKPNGTHYAPDTIYYLCLGIQQYLFENGRIDNIFTDAYFESFTDSLDEVAKKFSELFNDHHYIVTRVEEEHLWESKQLGAHSPHVLLSTLMFFNTKHFNLTNVDEHMMLSFSHIMKHWKRNPNQQTAAAGGKAPGSRNVLLRFYPPQSVLDDPNSKKKKVYEQHENEENPLRCPVKLYEFYMSKCPESVKSRSDVFYLQPERSCVPDSPVWYSTMALGKEPLEKLLNRVKMVKEINIALLTP